MRRAGDLSSKVLSMIVCIARDLSSSKKRRQLFIRPNHEAFAIVAVSINNKDIPPLSINDSDAAPPPA
jgi:hypothetical protein